MLDILIGPPTPAIIISSHHLPQPSPLPQAVPQGVSDPLNDPQSFKKDNLEFKSITTILSRLRSHDETEAKFGIPNFRQRYLKTLSVLAPLLVRDAEAIAILPKHDPRVPTIFITQEGDPLPLFPSSLDHVVTQNPPRNDKTYVSLACDVELLDNPVVEVGSDVVGYIVNNRENPFEHHVQVFVNLLDTALSVTKDDVAKLKAEINLKKYSLVQSIPKMHRRITKSTPITKLEKLTDPPNNCLATGSLKITPQDKRYICSVFAVAGTDGENLHPHLLTIMTTDITEQLSMLEFHEFFV